MAILQPALPLARAHVNPFVNIFRDLQTLYLWATESCDHSVKDQAADSQRDNGSMKTYRVEEIDNDIVQATHLIEAPIPFEAAERATRREVTLRRGEQSWIRVTETWIRASQTTSRARVFEYVAIGRERPS